eukprot:4823943-Amphidinium_carterae.1
MKKKKNNNKKKKKKKKNEKKKKKTLRWGGLAIRTSAAQRQIGMPPSQRMGRSKVPDCAQETKYEMLQSITIPPFLLES